jgi:hypothetical protein
MDEINEHLAKEGVHLSFCACEGPQMQVKDRATPAGVANCRFGRWLAIAVVMTYRVTFMERTGVTGEPSEAPAEYVAVELPEGVVLEKLFIDRTAPDALHSQEALEEDDSFLSVGSETWDYEVADGRKDDFIAALKNSQIGDGIRAAG